jgi:hypothetical protein
MIEFIASHRGGPICQTFKDLAARTWGYLDEGVRIGMAPGEETLTDDNLMAILALHSNQVAIKRFNKRQESKIGADWEWWFGNPANGWFGMRVQAKKLDLKQFSTYSGIDHPNNTCEQIENLIQESKAAGIFPAYCLYNTRLSPRLPEWGCSITSAQAMRNALRQPQARRSHTVAFKDIEKYLFPWHRLVCHPETNPPKSGGFPDFVRSSVLQGLSPDLHEDIPRPHGELPDYAKKVVVDVASAFEDKMVSTADSPDLDLPVKYLVVVSDQSIFPRSISEEIKPLRE